MFYPIIGAINFFSKFFKRESYYFIEGKSVDVGYDYLSKLIIFSDAGVGKTSLETHLDPVFDQKIPLEFMIGICLKKQIIKPKLQTKMYK